MKKELLKKIVDYFQTTIGLEVEILQYKKTTSLPFHFHDKFDFYSIKIKGNKFLLFIPSYFENSEYYTFKNILKTYNFLKDKIHLPGIFVNIKTSPYERKKLISNKIPFVIPNEQLYLPDLLINLSEHFNKVRVKRNVLTPSAQLAFLFFLKDSSVLKLNQSELAHKLSYTKMTLSRVFDELQSLNLANIKKEGKDKYLSIGDNTKELWNMALPFLISPVKKKILIKSLDPFLKERFLKSGLTALSLHSMLESPELEIFATDYKTCKENIENNKIQTTLFEGEAIMMLEIWKYPPELLKNVEKNTVDRQSLFLSLRNTNDERIKGEIENMTKVLKW